MFCNKCGTHLPDDSLFCIKCGTALTLGDPPNNEQPSNASTQQVKHQETSLAFGSSEILEPKKSKTKMIIAIVSVLIVIFLVYLFNYSSAVDAAKSFYYDSKYEEAENKINSYFPLNSSDSQLFKEIKLLNKCKRNLDYYEMYAFSKYLTRDMKSALRNLLEGYQICKENGSLADKYNIGYKYTSILNSYLHNLEVTYGISAEKADELINLDYSAKTSEIDKLYSIGEARIIQKEQDELDRELRNLNPIKFSEITLSSNSSYTILEGTVTNVSDKKLKFVEIKGLFKDSSDNVIDTDWTYAVGSEGLAPNESKKFRMSVKKDSRIVKASVGLKD